MKLDLHIDLPSPEEAEACRRYVEDTISPVPIDATFFLSVVPVSRPGGSALVGCRCAMLADESSRDEHLFFMTGATWREAVLSVRMAFEGPALIGMDYADLRAFWAGCSAIEKGVAVEMDLGAPDKCAIHVTHQFSDFESSEALWSSIEATAERLNPLGLPSLVTASDRSGESYCAYLYAMDEAR